MILKLKLGRFELMVPDGTELAEACGAGTLRVNEPLRVVVRPDPEVIL